MPSELEAAKQTVQVDGKDVVVYDAAKVEAFVTTKEQTFATEKTTLETNLKEATDKLAKVDEKSADFEGLRKAKETAETALKEKTDAHTKEIGELKAIPLTEHKTNLITLFAGDDKAVKEKLEFHLKNTVSAMPETTKVEIDAKTKAAYQLAIGSGYQEDFVSKVISTAGGAAYKPSGSGPTTELKGIGAKFGLTDKDFEAAQGKGLI